MNKSERLEGFNALPLKQRKAIISMVETDQSLEEIRKDVHVGRTAFYNWRNKDNAFMKGLREYSQHYLGQATAKAVRRVVGFIDNKNPYIAMQASLSVINLGGLGSVDGNNKLQEAQTRKAEADGRISAAKARIIEHQANELEGKGETNPLLTALSEQAESLVPEEAEDENINQ